MTEYELADTGRIYHLMYDSDYGLYLPEVRDRFKIINPFESRERKRETKLEKIKELVRQRPEIGVGIDIAKKLDMGNVLYLYMFLGKNNTGIRELVREYTQHRD